MRLTGESPYQGRVEICKRSIWGSVCYSSYAFSDSDATVTCRMLGYQPDYTLGEISFKSITLRLYIIIILELLAVGSRATVSK